MDYTMTIFNAFALGQTRGNTQKVVSLQREN